MRESLRECARWVVAGALPYQASPHYLTKIRTFRIRKSLPVLSLLPTCPVLSSRQQHPTFALLSATPPSEIPLVPLGQIPVIRSYRQNRSSPLGHTPVIRSAATPYLSALGESLQVLYRINLHSTLSSSLNRQHPTAPLLSAKIPSAIALLSSFFCRQCLNILSSPLTAKFWLSSSRQHPVLARLSPPPSCLASASSSLGSSVQGASLQVYLIVSLVVSS